jgi:hypothetical protein
MKCATNFVTSSGPGLGPGAAAGKGARLVASRWVAQLPEGSNRVAATGRLIDTWANRDAQAAAKWIEQLPAGASRDAAASTYAEKVRSTDPAAAMDWGCHR